LHLFFHPLSPHSHTPALHPFPTRRSSDLSRSASPPPDPAETTEEHSRGQVSAQATQREDRSARLAVTVFPVLIIAAALFGFFVPGPSLVLLPWVNILLGVIMFGMGLTLTVPDFAL